MGKTIVITDDASAKKFFALWKDFHGDKKRGMCDKIRITLRQSGYHIAKIPRLGFKGAGMKHPGSSFWLTYYGSEGLRLV